jgi:hypothetical protein
VRAGRRTDRPRTKQLERTHFTFEQCSVRATGRFVPTPLELPAYFRKTRGSGEAKGIVRLIKEHTRGGQS